MSRRKFNLSWKQAFAEIALIFVGITLAVAFQNWNENRKDELLRQDYHKRLLAELRQDLSDVNGISRYNIVRKESIGKFFDYLDANQRPRPDSLQRRIQGTSYHMNTYVPNENTYNELISTGNIKLIQTDIRERLLRLSQTHAYVQETERSFMDRYDDRRDQMAEVIDESSFYGQRKNANPKLLSWQRDINTEGFKRYSNLLAVRLNIANTLLDLYGFLIEQNEELIALIESETNSQ